MKDKRQQHKATKQNPAGKNVSHQRSWIQDTGNEKWIVLGILAITFIVFFPSLKNLLVNWDDDAYLTDNPIIKDLSLKNIWHIFNPGTTVVGNYHPLTVLSFCMEYHFFKLNPFLFHLDNILLHLLNVLGVYLFIKLLTKNFNLAAITALLFGIHPLRVESVTWVSERKDLLYTLFFIASLCCYLAYQNKSEIKFYILALAFFLFSILSKGQAVVLAPVLLLIDYFLGRKAEKKMILEKIPFFILAIFFGILAMKAQPYLAENKPTILPYFERILVAGYGIVMYLYKLFLPINLACYYERPATLDGFFYIAPVIAIILMILLFIFFRHNRIIMFGTLFFLVTISIVLQLIPVGNAVIADRYTYVPYLGLFLIVSDVFIKFYRKYSGLKTILPVLGLLYIGWFIYLTYNQTKVWKDSETLWNSALTNYPVNGLAYNNRGTIYFEKKEYDKAFSDYSQALKIIPNYITAMSNCGLASTERGKYDTAVYYFNMVIPLEPENASYYYSRGNANKKLGKTKEAIEDYTHAIELNPNYDDAFTNRGNIYFTLGKFEMAIKDYNRSIEIFPDHDFVYFNRSAAYLQIKNFKSALEDALKAKSMGYAVDQNYFDVINAGQK